MQPDIKKALKRGEIVIGSFFRLPSPDLVEIFGEAGFDFIILDQEHGPLTPESTSDLVRACDLVGLASIVRIPGNQPYFFQHALDVGASGIQIPQIKSVADADVALKSAKFAPEGTRGVCRNVRSARFSARDRFAYLEESNRDTIIVIQIESIEGVENVEEILNLPGVDVIFIGPYDLSQSYGIPGQVEHPELRKIMEHVVTLCRKSGTAVGIYADNNAAVKHWVGLGVQYLAVGIDTALIYRLAKDLVADLRTICQSQVSKP